MAFQKEIIEIIEPKRIVVGNPKATITLTEFGDYESEACEKANEVVKKLLTQYDGKIKFIFRHFPLVKYHQKAHKAAEAAIGAAQEGKFWEMHQVLLANRRHLGVISLKTHAREAGVKNKKFLDDLINGIYGWHVQGDLMEGVKLGVTTVPAFFVNGKKLEGEPTFKNLQQAIEGLLEKGTVKEMEAKKKHRA